MGGISKKKYGFMGNEQANFNNEQQLFSGNGHLSHMSPSVSLRNQQMKRPNTIANKHISGKVQATQQFDINGVRFGDKEEQSSPQSGTVKVSSLTNTMDRQEKKGNISDIFEKLDKYGATNSRANPSQLNSSDMQYNSTGTRQSAGGPPIISKDSIIFNTVMHRNNLMGSPQSLQQQNQGTQLQQVYSNSASKKNAIRHLTNKFQQLQQQ